MDKDRTTEDEIREYRAQFEKSMGSIAAYQEKARIEMAEFSARHDKAHEKALIELAKLRALHEEIAAEQKKTEELQKETDKQLKKTEAIVNRNAKQLSELNGNWGRFVESLVEGDLVGLLNRRGIGVNYTLSRLNASYALGDGRCREKEFDIVAVNGEEVVVVEVKTTLRSNDVKRFVDAMRDIARYVPDYGSKTVYGAVAYIRCESKSDKYAARQGLYVIRATGDSASIVNAEGFRPVPFTNVISRRPQGHLRAVPSG